MVDKDEYPPHRTALVLQGGGALGAYQAGVFEALTEYGCVPDWIAGTSIGAINAAIIAGNHPEHQLDRLREFWRRVSHVMPYHAWRGPILPHDDALLATGSFVSAFYTILFGQANFFRPNLGVPLYHQRPEAMSFYDTSPLRATLKSLVDVDVMNSGSPRLTVGAVSVTRGEMEYFDSKHRTLAIEHILASGALPPSLPPVRIDGELYWDGGIYSNTPLEVVLDHWPRQHTLCFVVNLWNERGREPTSLLDVYAREKEIRYSSRFRQEIKAFRERHHLRHAVRVLYEALPEETRNQAGLKTLADLGCHTQMDIVRLGPADQAWEPALKDADFESLSIRERWDRGYREARAVLEAAPWRSPRQDDASEGVRLFEAQGGDIRARRPGHDRDTDTDTTSLSHTRTESNHAHER